MNINAEAVRSLTREYNVTFQGMLTIERLARAGYTNDLIEEELSAEDRAAFIRYSFNNR